MYNAEFSTDFNKLHDVMELKNDLANLQRQITQLQITVKTMQQEITQLRAEVARKK